MLFNTLGYPNKGIVNSLKIFASFRNKTLD